MCISFRSHSPARGCWPSKYKCRHTSPPASMRTNRKDQSDAIQMETPIPRPTSWEASKYVDRIDFGQLLVRSAYYMKATRLDAPFFVLIHTICGTILFFLFMPPELYIFYIVFCPSQKLSFKFLITYGYKVTYKKKGRFYNINGVLWYVGRRGRILAQ